METTLKTPSLTTQNESVNYFTIQKIRTEFRPCADGPVDWGTIDAYIYVVGQPEPAPIPAGIGCMRWEWESRNLPKPTDSVLRLIRALLYWEQDVLTAARYLVRCGVSISPQMFSGMQLCPNPQP